MVVTIAKLLICRGFGRVLGGVRDGADISPQMMRYIMVSLGLPARSAEPWSDVLLEKFNQI